LTDQALPPSRPDYVTCSPTLIPARPLVPPQGAPEEVVRSPDARGLVGVVWGVLIGAGGVMMVLAALGVIG